MIRSTDGASLTQSEQALLGLVPAKGGTIGNGEARKRLQWSESDYWSVRDSLVDKALVLRGQGRGGTLRRVTPVAETATVTVTVAADQAGQAATVEQAIQREQELYEPMAAVLRDDWAKDRRAKLLAVENVARQGRRATGGTWSRPDLVTVEVKTYAYVPGKFLEIITFEVKPVDAINVQAVYEALAHRRSATHAYVLIHVPLPAAAGVQESIADVRTVARSHGIGLITAGRPADYATWEELEEAERHEPNPDRLDQFVSTQLSDHTKERIALALR